MSDAAASGAGPSAAEIAAADARVSYASVVAGQLRKNGAAMAALRVVLSLLVVAVGAPILSSNVPLLWRGSAGPLGASFPLLETLFDRFLYPSGVDVFFNLVLVVAPAWGLAARLGRSRPGPRRAWREFLVGRTPWASSVLAAGAALVVGGRAGLHWGGGALGWVALAAVLPWAGRGALLATGLLVGALAQPTLGLLLCVLAAPLVAAGALVLLFLAAVATGASTLGWVLLGAAAPGATAILLARLGRLGAPAAARRAVVVTCALTFVVGFVALQGYFRETRAVRDWRAAAEEGRVARERLAALEADAGGGRPAVPPADLEALRAAAATRAIFPPNPYHPDNTGETGTASIDRSLRAPGAENALGCDLNGRDVVARMIFGTRISMTIGLVAVSLFVSIGVILGSLAGYYLGWVDVLIQRFIEVMICFPTFFMLLTIIAVFDTRSIFMIMASIGVVGWPGVARLVRAEFLRQRGLDYVVAAHAQGIPERRIIFGHVLPNCMGPVLVSATLGVASSILSESGIAFLGLGDTNAASWGQMLTSGRDTHMWHLILVPGFAIFLVVTVFNLLGEGLRDALDPKLRR